jgi:hypothetical protein
MNAWHCASNSTFQLSILPTPAGNETATMVAVETPPSNDSIRRGERIPNIPPLPLEFLAIPDAQNKDEYAYHFRTTYDKVVFLGEDDLSIAGELQADPSTLGTPFQSGDNLWQCIFNATLLEGHISVPSDTETVSDTKILAQLPKFPYDVRLVEKWMPNGKAPYCRKMAMTSGGTLVPLSDEITLLLEDSQGKDAISTSKPTKRMKDREGRKEVRSSSCLCQWVVNN